MQRHIRSILLGKSIHAPNPRKGTVYLQLGIEALEDRITPSSAWWAGISSGSSFSSQYWGSWYANAGWQDIGKGDFTGDGKIDIAARTSSGDWWVGLSTGSSLNWQKWTTWSPGVTWQNVRFGDFDGDGKTDIAGQVQGSGQWWVALSNGSSFTNSLWTTWYPFVTWVDVQVGDFNGDGKTDIAGRVLQSGQWWVALSNGSSFTNSLWTTWYPLVTWVDVQVGDFNGDGKTDIVGRVLQSGQWWVGLSTGSAFSNSLWATWYPGVTWVDVKVGDFNGDGKADIIGRVLQSGQWWCGLSTGSGFSNALWATWSPAVSWVDVQIGDFNGDGKSDITGQLLQSGQWWTGLSTGSALNTTLWSNGPGPLSSPEVVSGNFQGTGKTDLLVLSSVNLYVSTHGSDTNDGTSPATAFRNISTALAHLAPAMTLYIEGGTYYEQVVVNSAGTVGNPITITSYNGTAVIDGSTQPWVAGSNQNLGMVELNSPYVTLQGIKIVNSLNTGIVLDADNLIIVGCEIDTSERHAISTNTKRQTNYPGLVGTMIKNITLQNNVVYDNVLLGHGFGQAISLIADGFLVAGNVVEQNVTEGIDIWLGAKHGEVAHNVVYGNGAAGIYVDGAAYVRIDDNRVFSNPRGIGVSSENPNYSTHDIWVYNNLSYNNTGSGIFLWDSPTNPGFHGSQNVLITNNTLVNNNTSIVLQGYSNTAEIMNNLGYATGSAISDGSTNSTYNIHNNVWLSAVVGFVSPSTGNFQLTSTSSAIDTGSPIPTFSDDLGNTYAVTTDFLGLNRNVNGVDAGAYEYQ